MTDGRFAFVYYEIPAEDVDGDLAITADIAFLYCEQIFEVDPARLVIQKHVDVGMDPTFPDDAVVFRLVRQTQAIVCDTAGEDLELSAVFHITLNIVGEE